MTLAFSRVSLAALPATYKESDMDDLVNRLTIKASVMEMGEKIAWGSDTSLMREAANRIEWMGERLDITQARIAELEAENQRLKVVLQELLDTNFCDMDEVRALLGGEDE